MHDNRFVLATRKSLIDGFFQSAPSPSLKDDEHYAWVQKKLGAPGYVLLYADAGAVWKAIRKYADSKTDVGPDAQKGFRVLDELGLDGLTAIGYTSRVVNGGVLDRFAIGFGPQPKGLLKLLSGLQGGSWGR